MPDETMRLLRRAVDHGLELACDFGEWDEDVRAHVLNAARMLDVFYLGRPSVFRAVELADNALRWRELRTDRPTTLEVVGEHVLALGEGRELIKVRDRAARAVGLPFDLGSTP